MILIRTDSSYKIGTGHVIRCLLLADLFREGGAQVQFICQDLPGNISQQVRERGYQVLSINEETETFSLVEALKPTWVVVDHYGLDHAWEERIQRTSKLFVIDDLLRKHQCDVLLDQNFRTDLNINLNNIPKESAALLGPEFCLLNPRLERKHGVSPIIKNILLFFGGSDSANNALQFYRHVINHHLATTDSFRFNLVVMKSHQHLAELMNLPTHNNLKLHIEPPNWPQMLHDNDFYIGSGGTVTWERLFVGLPGAVIAVADNQIQVSQELAACGLQYYWGDSGNLKWSELLNLIAKLPSQERELSFMHSEGQKTVNRLNLNHLNSIAEKTRTAFR
jgi:UDP-2,4-diacetamido-2,4,6-trideoxy-beta-L-altropyranose hydrolase